MSHNILGFEKDSSEAETVSAVTGPQPAEYYAARRPVARRPVTVPEDTALRYARQTCNAVVTLAVIAVAAVIISLILGIVMLVGIHR
jgi:hypothetical protein